MTKLSIKQKRFADEYIISGNAYGVVYCIENMLNHKKYIGITTRKVSKRFEEHCQADSVIGRAIRKYGKDNFTVKIISEANDREELLTLEVLLIKKYGTFASGYNQTIGGEGVNSDYFIEPVLNRTQAEFVSMVECENKKKINVDDDETMRASILMNMALLYLVAIAKVDKRAIARTLLKVKRPFISPLIERGIFSIDELRGWASWRNIPTG